MRIAAQLTEAKAGTVMWSDRYDGELTDIFEFQTRSRVGSPARAGREYRPDRRRRRLDRPRPDRPPSISSCARAIGHAASRTTNRQFRELITKAIELDPNYAARGPAGGGAVLASDPGLVESLIASSRAAPTKRARRSRWRPTTRTDTARSAAFFSLVPNDGQNALKRAIEINSDANALAPWGAAQSFSGDIAGAIDSLQLALKLDPMLEPSYVSIWRSRTISRAGTRMPCALPSAGSGAIPISSCSMRGGGGRCPAGTHGGGHRLCRGAPPPPAGLNLDARIAVQGSSPTARIAGRPESGRLVSPATMARRAAHVVRPRRGGNF